MHHASLSRLIEQHLAGEVQDALHGYRRLLADDPALADAHHNAGIALAQLSQPALSMRHLQMALSLKSNEAQYWQSYIELLVQADLRDVAKQAAGYAAGRLSDPATRQALAHRAGGTAQTPDGAVRTRWLQELLEAGRHAEAEQMASQQLLYAPCDIAVWIALSLSLYHQDRIDDALPVLRHASVVAPAQPLCVRALVDTLMRLKVPQQAWNTSVAALVRFANDAELHALAASAAARCGLSAQAIAHYQRAIQLQPAFAAAHNNLGIVQQAAGLLDDAAQSFARALELMPDSAIPLNNIGLMLLERGELSEAEQRFRDAVRISPDYAVAHNSLGNLLRERGEFAAACACFETALSIDPGFLTASSSLVFALNCSLAPARQCLAAARHHAKLLAAQLPEPYAHWPCLQHDETLRVGLVSGDLRAHPVGYFLEAVLAELVASGLQIHAYANQSLEDAATARLKAHCTVWRNIAHLDDADAAAVIRADGVHVLIDLAGHTAHSRLGVFSLRAAPLQVSWLGYFATTGLAAIDYVIADPPSAPASEQAHFVERIVHLPETRLCFTIPDVRLEPGALPALSAGHLTWGCCNNLPKLTEQVIRTWSQLLQAAPGSALLLKARQLGDAAVADTLRGRFAVHGISPDRLHIEGPSARGDYLRTYHRIDIALDPFPFPGGTTTVESLWMGVPVLTLAGDRLLSRQGAALLGNAGLDTWIASDTEDYVRRALAFAADLPALAALRQGLRAQVEASPLFDAPRFARHFQTLLHELWRERLAALS